MNLELKSEWKSALKSGLYFQGFKYLRRYDCFCALGVLGDICVKKGMAEWKENILIHNGTPTIYDLPKSLMLEINMNSQFQNKVIGMNDKKMMLFTHIADLID